MYVFYKKVCQEGWDAVHNSCYRILSGQVDQWTGRADCEKVGGRLALVSTEAEMDAVGEYMSMNGILINHGAWVDGTDAVTDGVWLSESGDEMHITWWSFVEPNGQESENCLGISNKEAFDISCSGDGFIQYTLCEF